MSDPHSTPHPPTDRDTAGDPDVDRDRRRFVLIRRPSISTRSRPVGSPSRPARPVGRAA